MNLPRYSDLMSFNVPEDRLARFIPQRKLGLRVHNDPEFETYTYADYPTRSPRSVNLMKLEPMDYLFFIARLAGWKAGRFTGEAGFFLIGYLEIEEILRDATEPPGSENFEKNAHVRRARLNPIYWDGFWAFRGSKNSRRFVRAFPFTRAFATQVMRDKNGLPWRWGAHRSDLQVIGSYTRSCRIMPSESTEEFWKALKGARVT